MAEKAEIKSKFEKLKANATQALFRAIGDNVIGTRESFRAVGNGSEIQADNADINAGLGAGNPDWRASEGTWLVAGGTDKAFKAESGGKMKLTGARINSGAFSGGAASRNALLVKHNGLMMAAVLVLLVSLLVFVLATVLQLNAETRSLIAVIVLGCIVSVLVLRYVVGY